MRKLTWLTTIFLSLSGLVSVAQAEDTTLSCKSSNGHHRSVVIGEKDGWLHNMEISGLGYASESQGTFYGYLSGGTVWGFYGTNGTDEMKFDENGIRGLRTDSYNFHAELNKYTGELTIDGSPATIFSDVYESYICRKQQALF